MSFKIYINNREIDYFDDEGMRSEAMAHAIQQTAMVPSKHLRQALEGLFCDTYVLFLKAQGLVFYHDARSHKFMEVEAVKELVEYVRAVLGEGPSVNDSVVVPVPEGITPTETPPPVPHEDDMPRIILPDEL